MTNVDYLVRDAISHDVGNLSDEVRLARHVLIKVMMKRRRLNKTNLMRYFHYLPHSIPCN